MKTLKNIFNLLLTIGLVSCDGNDDSDWDNEVPVSSTGGLLTIDKGLISYVVGDNATYTTTGKAFQANTQTTSVSIYKSFTNIAGESSNKELLTTLPISDLTVGQTANFSHSFTYEDLISGLTVAGSAISPSDGDLNIGDFFTLEYESVTSAGNTVAQVSTTKVSVGTRFAGTYDVIKGEYFRIGANNGGGAMWTGGQVNILSIDAITYQWSAWGEYSGWGGNVLYFQIDPVTLEITYPAEWNDVAQTLNGQPITTYPADASDLTNVIDFTTTPNVVILDNVERKDQLDMIYGYFTAGSGPREFYHLLEKVIE